VVLRQHRLSNRLLSATPISFFRYIIMPDFCSWNGVGWVKAGPWSSGRGTRLEWGTWGLRHWRVANENWGAGGTEWGGDLKRGVASLPSRLQEVWRSVVVSSPIGVHGGATVGNAFWHILGSQNTSDRQKMRFFAQCNAQNWHICMKTTS